jgi:hypothetical protein
VRAIQRRERLITTMVGVCQSHQEASSPDRSHHTRQVPVPLVGARCGRTSTKEQVVSGWSPARLTQRMDQTLQPAVALLSLTMTHGQQSTKEPSRHNYEFINGHWFDGEKFTSKTFYSIGELLSTHKPRTVDSVIDLRGKYVVPPFGEAHNHNVEGDQC